MPEPQACQKPERFSLFPNGIRPSSDGKWVKHSDYKRVANLLETFVEVYGEAPLTGDMIVPGRKLWRDYYELSGDHMILTDEGWEPGEARESYLSEYGPDSIQDEVNAPPEAAKAEGRHAGHVMGVE